MTIEEAIKHFEAQAQCKYKPTHEAAELAVAALRAQQALVDAHGQWQGEGDGYANGEIVYDVWKCSRCGHIIDDGTDDPDMLPNYCPDCGAKMDGGTAQAPPPSWIGAGGGVNGAGFAVHNNSFIQGGLCIVKNVERPSPRKPGWSWRGRLKERNEANNIRQHV